MTRLILLEIRRWVSRRLVRGLTLLVLFGTLLASILVFVNHQTADAEELARRRSELSADVDRCQRGEIYPPGEEVEVIFEGVGFSGPAPGLDREFRGRFCTLIVQATATEDPRFHLTQLEGVALGTTTPLVLLSLVLGASFIGAEWRANTVATQLTWEPRRIRLILTKAVVAITLGAAFYVLAEAVIAGGLLPSVFLRGTTEGADTHWYAMMGGILGRGAALAALASTIGFALATIGKNTTAALGILFGYIALAEGAFFGNIWPGSRQWLLLGNSIVFASGNDNLDFVGRSPTEAGVLLGIYASAALIASAVWFARRDVA